jgi:hypothetical protein
VVPFTPALVGGSLGARWRVWERTGDTGPAIELGLRGVGVATEQRIDRSQDGLSQTDYWDYRALGVEVPAVGTWRINPIFAVTASPFLRAYWIRAWHTEVVGLTRTQVAIPWSPVISGGLGAAAAMTLGPVEISPGAALELATRPGPGAATKVLFEPGVSLGTRF